MLIVDDNEASRRAIRSLLSSRPNWLICGEAADGLEAVDKAKALLPDVVLMDISMPRMNGLEATRIIRRDLPESKVVILSQNDPAIARSQALEVDAAACVDKMEIVQRLLPTLESLIRARDAEGPVVRKPTPATVARSTWVAGSSELAKLIREKDWSQTSLGPIETWPQSLRIAVNLMLNSRHPMWVGWGPEMPFLYNDAYISVLGSAKHSNALGLPAREVWKEIWDICGPLAEKVFEKGEATFVDDVHFFMNRGDFLEETYVSFSYNPIYNESGKVAGLFCPNTETTSKILNARRLQTLSELSSKALVERSIDAACASCFATLGKNPDDLPFALLYLLDKDGTQAVLEQSTGVSKDLERMSPSRIDLQRASAESEFWRLGHALSAGQAEIVSLRHLDSVPLGPAGQRLAEAITLPVSSGRQDSPLGVLIAGISPARKLDAEYRAFFELLAGQVATAIHNARAAEEERKRAEALAEIDRAKTVFFSNVSHEFRTPLALMLGPVEDLLSRSHTDLSPAAKQQLELVNRNGSRLLRLVNTLLDFSRIEAGRMQVVYQPTDLSAFTTELASVFRSATEKAGLRLELDCPKISQPVFIDRDMWEKIVLNLISNALKFTFEGVIGISLAQIGDAVELRFRDTGVGIPANELPRLFDRFHRVENTRSRTHEGSGIGLSLVQELAKLHGGTVSVESELGKGSTFTVSVPFGTAHLPADRIGTRSLASTSVGATPFVEEVLGWLASDQQASHSDELPREYELMPVPCPPLGEADEGSAQRPRVLIADDNADMRRYLLRLLAERYNVAAVPNGAAALQSARERAPDLILSDVMMPELDGFGLVRELRADAKLSTIPIILLSARAGEESRIEGMERGADDYLIKPFSARELLARIQTHLELARVRKQSQEILRQRTAQFEALLDAAPLGVYLVDADLRILHMNPTARESFASIPDVVGRDFDDVVHIVRPKAYADKIVAEFRRTLESGEPYFVPEGIDNGADRVVREIYEWQINRIPLPDGKSGVVCYFRDISRQIEARETIAQTGERLRLATEAAELGIWQWYPAESRAAWENDRMYEIFGRAREAGPYTLLSEFTERVIHPDDRSGFEQALVRSLETGARFFFQSRIFRGNGTLAWVEFTAQAEYKPDRSFARLLGTALDITERKRAEEELRLSEEKLRTLADELESQVRARTGELEQRNAEIVLQSEQVRELSRRLLQAQDEERRHIARELHDSAGQIVTALAMNLASVGQRAEKSDPRIAADLDDCRQLAQQLSQEIRTTSYLLYPPLLDESGLHQALQWYVRGLKERSSLQITLDVSEDFGRLPREMELVVYRLVQECLTNIHRHSGSRSASIRLEREGRKFSLQIEDAGKGIPAEKLNQLQSQGAGVGLRGMSERIRQFDGRMNIRSSDQGTTISFLFELPETASPNPTDMDEEVPAAD